MVFIGDCHGIFKTYEYILFKMQHKGNRKGVDCSCQVGDMGIGFKDFGSYVKNGVSWSPEIDIEHKFIRGNHDDPAMCKKHPNYIGDWGFIKEPSIFYVGGGFSIDWESREPGFSWWEDEELSVEEMFIALETYKVNKPRIVVSHECPLGVKIDFVTNTWKFSINSRTEKLLQNMFEVHQPEYWIFGHHHKRKELDKNGTHFVCLDELTDGKINDCIYEIKDLTWKG